MTTELLIWIISFFVCWEIVYILMIAKYSETWINLKGLSFLITFLFFITNLVIISNGAITYPFHYINFAWAYGGMIIIALFFYMNKQLYKWINKDDKKKKNKR